MLAAGDADADIVAGSLGSTVMDDFPIRWSGNMEKAANTNSARNTDKKLLQLKWFEHAHDMYHDNKCG